MSKNLRSPTEQEPTPSSSTNVLSFFFFYQSEDGIRHYKVTGVQTCVLPIWIGEAVRLAGTAPYGPELLRRLATFDALLFPPTAEDTPRMIFDGYAAGLPLVGDAIPYVCERADEEHATLLLPADAGEAAARLAALAADRRPLADLTRAAHRAGEYHAADAWYKRRAE